jgi:UDP-glucose 6-dehydrogenase
MSLVGLITIKQERNKMKIAIVGKGVIGEATSLIFDEVEFHDPAKGSVIEDFSEFHYSIVCVPTPLLNDKLDHAAIRVAVTDMIDRGFNGVIVIRSTCEPNLIQELSDEYHSIIYWPEFLRERNSRYEATHPLLVVLGGTEYLTKKFREDLESVNHGGVAKWALTDVTTASIIKLGLNTAIAAKITTFNALRDISDGVGANWEMVRHSIGADFRIGMGSTEVPGPDKLIGFGGKCLPKDVTAFNNLVGNNLYIDAILAYNETLRNN